MIWRPNASDCVDNLAASELIVRGTTMTAKSARVPMLATIILFVAVVAKRSAAQSRVIRGIVTDESGAAIPKTAIEISCSQKGHVAKVAGVQSTTDGSFQLEANLIGTCKVSFSAIGFKPLQRPLRGSASYSDLDLGTIRLRIKGCSDPGIICDEVTPAKPKL